MKLLVNVLLTLVLFFVPVFVFAQTATIIIPGNNATVRLGNAFTLNYQLASWTGTLTHTVIVESTSTGATYQLSSVTSTSSATSTTFYTTKTIPTTQTGLLGYARLVIKDSGGTTRATQPIIVASSSLYSGGGYSFISYGPTSSPATVGSSTYNFRAFLASTTGSRSSSSPSGSNFIRYTFTATNTPTSTYNLRNLLSTGTRNTSTSTGFFSYINYGFTSTGTNSTSTFNLRNLWRATSSTPGGSISYWNTGTTSTNTPQYNLRTIFPSLRSTSSTSTAGFLFVPYWVGRVSTTSSSTSVDLRGLIGGVGRQATTSTSTAANWYINFASGGNSSSSVGSIDEYFANLRRTNSRNNRNNGFIGVGSSNSSRNSRANRNNRIDYDDFQLRTDLSNRVSTSSTSSIRSIQYGGNTISYRTGTGTAGVIPTVSPLRQVRPTAGPNRTNTQTPGQVQFNQNQGPNVVDGRVQNTQATRSSSSPQVVRIGASQSVSETMSANQTQDQVRMVVNEQQNRPVSWTDRVVTTVARPITSLFGTIAGWFR